MQVTSKEAADRIAFHLSARPWPCRTCAVRQVAPLAAELSRFDIRALGKFAAAGAGCQNSSPWAELQPSLFPIFKLDFFPTLSQA